MIGRALSHYRILESLGRGGMGEVYLAEDPKLRRRVAIKILPPDLAADPERRMRFKREAQAVAALNHPNIVTIHSVEEAEGVPFITMELVEGEPLSRKIRGEGLSSREIFEVAIPVADALAAAHERGIVHRDIKPDNVMMTKAGRVKLLDFGLARTAENAAPTDEVTSAPTAGVTQQGMILGTVSYMSPEQAEGGSVDARSDVFSLGVVLYEMATGRKPFQGKSTISTITSILRDTPPSITEVNPALPRHLGRIVTRCLAKDPERRYQSAKEVRNELEQLKEETSSTAIPRSPVDVTTVAAPAAHRGKKPLVAAAAGIGSAAVLALLAFIFLRPGAGGPDLPPTPGVAAPGSPLAPAPPGAGGALPEASIAVLPFASVGTDDESVAFSSGMHNDLLTQLSKIDSLKVISRTSVMEYRGTSKNLRRVAEELGVATIMEGSVQRAGQRLRINAQLIDARSDRHLWAETYDRELTTKNVFDIQADIARQIAAALQARLSPEDQKQLESRPTDNLEAYEAYIKSLDLDMRGQEESYSREATALMEKAVALDPGFALASAQLARLQLQLYWMHYDRSAERLVRARQMIDNAFRAEPNLPEAHMALGYYHYWGFLEYDRALEEFGKAAESQPNNAYVLGGIGYVKRRQGRMEEALERLRKTAELDPRNTITATAVAETLSLLRRYDAAEAAFRRALDLNPSDAFVASSLAQLKVLRDGDVPAAREVIREAEKLGARAPELTEMAIAIDLCARDYASALQRLDLVASDTMLDNQYDRFPTDLVRARVLLLQGHRDEARRRFDAAREMLERWAHDRPHDERLHSALGIVYAGLGRKDDALRAGRRGMELLPIEKEAMRGSTRGIEMALIYTMTGETRQAIDQLEFLLSRPGLLSKAWLRVDPFWDPLRGDPRFAQLVKQTPPKTGNGRGHRDPHSGPAQERALGSSLYNERSRLDGGAPG